MTTEGAAAEPDVLKIEILGRTLQHLGKQTYKRRDLALAELVANAWDAGAPRVTITFDEDAAYDPATSKIVIEDEGSGMDFRQVRDEYLVIGRNRRETDGLVKNGRPLMGRKGIGKLAGFGIAKTMTILTWRDGEALQFTLDSSKLKARDGTSEARQVDYERVDPPNSEAGTRIVLTTLAQSTPLDPEAVRLSIARRFARTVRGDMAIVINGQDLPDPTPPLDHREPSGDEFSKTTLADGLEVEYWYGFASKLITFKDLRGFTIQVNGKTAEAPPFFFDVEGTASGQHSTRYLIGEIVANGLDTSAEDEKDYISTDRQELDWEADALAALKQWGDGLARKALIECTEFRGKKTEEELLRDPDLKRRVEALDETSEAQVRRFLKILGPAINEEEDAMELASSLVRAYEYRHFHDVIGDIEDAAQDPDRLRDVLLKLGEWRVLEGRALLEIIKGRLEIIDKFGAMIVNDAPESAARVGDDNLHDLLGRFPWLLNPEWQVLSEETGITTQLREWADVDIEDAEDRTRYDFLALANDQRVVVIEIKRPGHSIDYKDLHQLEGYRERLAQGTERDMHMVLIHGGEPNISDDLREVWDKSSNRELRP